MVPADVPHTDVPTVVVVVLVVLVLWTMVVSLLMVSHLKIVERDVKMIHHALVTTCLWLELIGVKHIRLSELQEMVERHLNVGRKV